MRVAGVVLQRVRKSITKGSDVHVLILEARWAVRLTTPDFSPD